MTRCCRDSMNLKSSAYNQTGQSCVEQLSVYRSMCSHLRRVLMAKSVVDTRNPRFARTIQRRCRPTSCKLSFLDGDFCCLSSQTIDRLAYDTEHHPSEIIRVTCRGKSSAKERSCSRGRERAAVAAANNDANCPCLRPATAKGHTTGIKSNMKNQKRPTDDCCADCRTSACLGCRKWSLHEETAPAESLRGDEQTFRKLAEREEEALYAKFVYDITQEIVQNGLYTDRELKEVFAKHLERSSARLNKRKMLYEIYQLKISLNMLEDSDEEDEVEADLVFAEKFSHLRVPKPPTPPKVLNENKIIEKLQSFKNHENGDRSGMSSPSGGRKSVVLIDANPEFLVTERDVLATLADNRVEPQQIQRIYKKLFRRSKDMSLCEAVQVGTEVAYSHRLKQVDRCTSATSLNSTYMRERPHGILRKESTDFLGKSLSPQTTRCRYSYVSDKCNEALEKCAKWKTCPYGCRAHHQSPCKQHQDLVGKEKAQSPEKIASKEVVAKDKPEKKPSPDKKVKVVKQPAKVKKPEKIKTKKPIKVLVKKKEVKSSPETSEGTSSLQEVITEEKHVASSKAQSDLAQENAASEEHIEEIEEDIESVIEESPTKSSRRSSPVEDKPDNEDKEQASSPEKNNDDNDEEISSIATENESAKYSDDFSDVSEDSEDPSKTRYASMKDYFDHFATVDEQKIWRISEGSSSSSSSTSLMNPESAENANNEAQQQQQQQQQQQSKIIKKRSSSKVFINAPNDSWRPGSSDFYTNALVKYCDPDCRNSSAKSCSDNCKFVRTNCRNLSRPTNCLNKLKQPVLSESTSTTS
ncbi:uncharacterized protein LOC131665261 [Phymastichus coffea]|uniref:uncharacterized protein LOC131665261 n=1 Tax=Phymastichus coffea TaxID=108790 RepID=UPI00273C20C9|nr:uncharacterized protein LOC131665261 [Phymastichus coffea]